jgi:Protein of unknown function (DUF1579)
MAALQAFHFNCTWTGSVEPGGMGPGSPAMTAHGKAAYHPIMDGAWLVGDFEQEQYVDNQHVLTWQAHFVVGWDPRAAEYRCAYVDNTGSATLLRGRLAGRRFIIETQGGGAVQNRMQWTLQDDGSVAWRNDCSIGSGPWTLVEEYICIPA